jgi:anti-sigma regulatory factor (Ser/Thr protein kinase)
VAVARRFVTDTLVSWDGAHDHAAAALMAGELVTNAIMHARSPVVVTVRYEDPVVTVEVQDESDRPPVNLLVGPNVVHGRGVHLVATMADSWGVRRVPGDGKVVWFTLRPE